MIRGVRNPYSVLKGSFVGEEKCIVMTSAKLWAVQGPKQAKRHAIYSIGLYLSP